MKIYDISQELFGCEVFPDDPTPKGQLIKSMDKGDLYNLTVLSLCAHNGTHIDAPRHFIKDGKAVDEMALDAFVGMAFVAEHQGTVGADDAARMLERAKKQSPEAAKRILLKGELEVSKDAAEVFAAAGILLLGNEPQTVGPKDAPMAVHLVLLGAGVVLLEGIRLSDIPEGAYLLSAAPLNLAGSDGSPCRAVLISAEE